jgi:hypothetical protein
MNIVFKMLSRLSDRKLQVNVNTDETRLCFHNILFYRGRSVPIPILVYLKIPILELLSWIVVAVGDVFNLCNKITRGP